MDWFVRNCVLGLMAALLAIGGSGQAKAEYDIPDDCLGSWKYCKSFKLRHFTDYGPYFTEDRRFLPDHLPPDLDDAYPERIRPLTPRAGSSTPDMMQ